MRLSRIDGAGARASRWTAEQHALLSRRVRVAEPISRDDARATAPSGSHAGRAWPVSARTVAVVAGVLLTVMLLGLQLRAHRHAGALWRDEVDSVNVAKQPTIGQVLALSHLDSFPAAWVTVLHGWIVLGQGASDLALRRLGLSIATATIGVVWWTGWRLGIGAPLGALLLFAMSPTTIVYGGGVRGYGLGALGIAWFMGALWRFLRRGGRQCFVVAQAAAIVAAQSYFGNCFLLLALCAAGGLVCLRRGARRTLLAVLTIGVVAALTMLIDLPSILYAARLAPTARGSYGVAWLASVFGHALAPDVPVLAVAWAAAALLGVVGAILAWRSRDDDVDRERVLFTSASVLVALPAYYAFVKYIGVRTEYWYYLGLMAVIALALDANVAMLARRMRGGEWARIAAVGAVALLAWRGVAATVAVRMTNLDVVAQAIAASGRPDDLAVVYPWYCGITFQRYYRGATPWITLPDFAEHEFHLHALVKEKMMLGDAALSGELARVERTLRAGGRVWVVGEPVAPPPGQPPPSLAPAPSGPEGWRVDGYLEGWALALGALLQEHGRTFADVGLPDLGAVNRWERLPLSVVQGWR
jgi:hypothetical protein